MTLVAISKGLGILAVEDRSPAGDDGEDDRRVAPVVAGTERLPKGHCPRSRMSGAGSVSKVPSIACEQPHWRREICMEGQCTCGSVRFRLMSRPLFVHGCRCLWCQHKSGSAFALPCAQRRGSRRPLQGALAIVMAPCKRGKRQSIARLPVCRIALCCAPRAPTAERRASALCSRGHQKRRTRAGARGLVAVLAVTREAPGSRADASLDASGAGHGSKRPAQAPHRRSRRIPLRQNVATVGR